MPPWPPGKRSPEYVGQSSRILSAQQRASILAWARAGGKIDGPARKPTAQKGPEVRQGEALLDLKMQATYTPSAPKGITDDYRCFLLDPKQAGDSFVTSARIVPGQPKIVHHVILFKVGAAQLADAKRARRRRRRPGLVVLRRDRASGRRRSGDRRLAQQRELDRRVGAGLGREPPPGGHRRHAPCRKQDRDAGALQPAQRPRAGSLARAAHRRAGVGEAHPAADGAHARPRRARVREERAGEALRPERGALRPREEVRDERRVHAGRSPHPLPRERRQPSRECRLDVRSAHHDADDDLHRSRPHASARRVDQARAESRNSTGEGASRHPALGLPLAERLHARRSGQGAAR